jgi:hypothetical protein
MFFALPDRVKFHSYDLMFNAQKIGHSGMASGGHLPVARDHLTTGSSDLKGLLRYVN